jgi:hypothetical protein
MRLRAFAFVAFFILAPNALISRADAQEYTIVNSVRLPAESFVGDPIELRYHVRTAARMSNPATLPEPVWGAINSVRVTERDAGYDVRIVVVPYETGTLTIPPLTLGGLVLDGLSLVVSSVLEDRSEVRSIYGPQRLPGTRLALLLAVLGVAVPAAIALYLVGPGRSLVSALRAGHRARIPYRNLLRTIDGLEKGITRDSARDFYTRLVASVQDLMTSRLGFECRSATSSELTSYLPSFAERCGAEPDVAAPLAEVFSTADEAKFAHRPTQRNVRERHLRTCRVLVVDLETSRRRKGSSGRKGGDHVGV